MAERTLRDLIAPGVPNTPVGPDLGKVKRNVGRMVDQGAPDEEIDAYIADEGTTIDAVKAFRPQSPDVVVDMAKGTGYGFNEGLDASLNMLASPVRGAMNLIPNALGYEGIPELELARRANVAGPAETQAGRVMQAVGEVAGSSVLPAGGVLQAGRMMGTAAPSIIGMAARKPLTSAGLEAASVAGSGAGVATARENELGPVAEVGLGLVGGVAVPNVGNIAARTYGAGRSAANYAGRQIERARDPVTAAYRDVADQGVKAGFDFEEARRSVSPPRSGNLERRGFTENDLAEIISRQANGENADDVVRDYAHLVDAQGRSLTGDTAKAYLQRYQAQNPTDLNIVDMAKIQRGTGGAMPLANQARADMAIADDPLAAQRLIERQRSQPGRVAEHIEQSGIEGRNLNQELDRLATTGKAEEDAAYGLVRKEAQPIDLRGVLGKARRIAHSRSGEVGRVLNEAIDLFFKPVTVPKRISALQDVRLKEMAERIAEAEGAKNPNPARIEQLKRRFDAMRDDLEYEQNAKPVVTKPGDPIDDVGRFIDARDELNQLTKRSMQDGQPTPLTQQLTQLRGELNAAARLANKSLAAADAKFSENRSIESIIKRGQDLGKKLTPQTKRALREFEKLTPTQQEIQRVAFEDRMASEALGVKRGNAAADQFNSEAFDRIVEAMYPKSAGDDIFARGQTLLKRLKGEAVTTETARDILSGSRTAPLADDMAQMMEGPRAAADALTGRFGKLLENLSNRLTRQIGQKAAQERILILTNTDPATRLTTLRRLAEEAKTAGERAQFEMAIRNFAKVGRRPGAEIGTVTPSNESSDR